MNSRLSPAGKARKESILRPAHRRFHRPEDSGAFARQFDGLQALVVGAALDAISAIVVRAAAATACLS
jgi:hypothetical protein